MAAASRKHDSGADTYELPTFDPGRALISDHRAVKELVDDEDIDRALHRP